MTSWRSAPTAFAVLSISVGAACTPGIGAGAGGGGAGSTSTSGQGTSTSAASGATTSGATSSSTGAGGGGPKGEFLYKRSFPATGAWTKVAIADAFPGDPNVPTSNIVSAVRLQLFPWMMWITGDNMIHVALSDVWQTPVPIDAGLGIGLGCKKIDQHLSAGQCVNDSPQPDCQPLSAQSGFVMTHVPGTGCSNMPMKEGVSLITASIATVFDVTGPSGTISYVGQRDYLTDCDPDPPSVSSLPLWGFQIARPASCPGDWYDTYVFRANHNLYGSSAVDMAAGVDTHVWPVDTTNPLIGAGADPNQPDLTKVTAAYYDHATSTVVLIAP